MNCVPFLFPQGDDTLDLLERTSLSTVQGEVAIPNTVPTVINSITIVETPGDAS